MSIATRSAASPQSTSPRTLGPFAPQRKEEAETIFTLCDAEPGVISVYSSQPAMIRRLLRNREIVLREIHRDGLGRTTGAEFVLPISCLRIRERRRASASQLRALAMARRAAAARHAADQNGRNEQLVNASTALGLDGLRSAADGR